MIQRLPFYSIFDALRKNGFPLGISEYKDLIEILSGYQYQPREAIIERGELLDICKTLWLKPNQVPIAFQTIFNEQYDRIFQAGNKTGLPADTENTTAESKRHEGSAGLNDQMSLERENNKSEDQSSGREENALSQSRGVRLVLGPGKENYQQVRKEKVVEQERRFLFSDNYFPVTLREVQQLFSRLPERKQQKAESEIDIDATVHSIARDGYFMEAAYKKKEVVLNSLVILHDHKGSMVAFEKLSEMFSKAALTLFKNSSTYNNGNNTYYFQNATEKYIYLNKANTTFKEMSAFAALLQEKKVMLVIVSDAGAARGSNSDIRVRSTIRMLMTLQKITNRIVWLNPMPEDRWPETAAERIAEFVPMFSIHRKGLMQAADSLRGKQVKIN